MIFEKRERGGGRGGEREKKEEEKGRKRTRVSCFSNRERDLRYLHRAFAPYVPFRLLSQPRASYIDRCADELVDAFIAVLMTSLFRGGALPSHGFIAIPRVVSRISIARSYIHVSKIKLLIPKTNGIYLWIFNIDILHIFARYFIFI